VLGIGAYSTEQLLIDNCTFTGKQAIIGPGGKIKDDEWQQVPRNKSVRLTRSTFDELNSAWTQTESLTISQCTISSADFSNSRIGSLQIEASTISQKLDLSNTRIKSHSIKDLEPSKHRQVLLDGSTIKQI
jgi:hypothetical protein